MASTSEVLVLGGGFAGLSCASALAQRGLSVTVLEKKPHLGGRAYSFSDPHSGESVDNGQHLFMGCYRETRRFLERIGTAGRLGFGESLRVDFADASGRRDLLSCPRWLGAPWSLAWAVWGLRGLTLADKWGLIRLAKEMRRLKKERSGESLQELDNMTVRQWLDRLGQSRRIQERLFDPIALGALNDDPELAAATGFAQVLEQVFFTEPESARLGLSRVGLSELYADAARNYIEAREARVLLSRKARALLWEEGGVRGVACESGEVFRAQATVSTLAPWDLGRLDLPPVLRGAWQGLKASPIISLCLWLDRPLLGAQTLVGMLGTDVQWAFNKGRILGRTNGGGEYLSLVISGARRHVSWDPKALLELARRDLASGFPGFRKAKITRWKVVKEPYATLSPVPGSEALRPGPGLGAPGFYFAGDWTRTGLPATIESAVVSGHRVAELI